MQVLERRRAGYRCGHLEAETQESELMKLFDVLIQRLTQEPELQSASTDTHTHTHTQTQTHTHVEASYPL